MIARSKTAVRDGSALKKAGSNPLASKTASAGHPYRAFLRRWAFRPTIDPGRFTSGCHFAAWLGLTPKERSTGGRQRLGGISRAGNERLRQLLVVGAMAVIRYAKPGSKTASAWLLALLERKPRKLAAVALANKMARVVWAMMATGEAYRGSKGAAASA